MTATVLANLDMDECESGDNACEDMCVNTEGGYECSCEEGRQLASDAMSCEEIEVSVLGISDMPSIFSHGLPVCR